MIPTGREVVTLLDDMLEKYNGRNKVIARMRRNLVLKNPILAPDVSHYNIEKIRKGNLVAFREERLAQLRTDRTVRVIQPGLSSQADASSDSFEKAIEAGLYWMRRDRDTFSSIASDVLMLEGAVECWEAIPKMAFPLLIPGEDGQDEITKRAIRKVDDPTDQEKVLKAVRKEREDYKKVKGWPLQNRYVPLEYYFPEYDGDSTEFAIEVEFRPLRRVLNSKLFDKSALNLLKAKTGEFRTGNSKLNIKDQCVILRWCDDVHYAYFALFPTTYGPSLPDWGDPYAVKEPENDVRLTGFDAVLLHSYEHGIGTVLYNEFFGAHGGWRSENQGAVIGRLEAMMSLSEAIDYLSSQGATYVRNVAWPTYIFKLSTKRPPTMDDSPAANIPIRNKVGQDIYLYEDEDARPSQTSLDIPMYRTMIDQLEDQFRMIAGSPSLYGQHQPGVSTGYQQQLLITRSESQFARVEQGLANGSVNGIYKGLLLLRAMGETVYSRAPGYKQGLEYYETLAIDPEKQLKSLPMLDVSVRAPRPMDLTASLADARNALSPIEGGPRLLSRQSVLSDYLGVEHPNDELLKIRIEDEEEKMWQSGLPSKLIAQQLGTLIVQDSAQQPDPFAQAQMQQNPAFVQQMQQFVMGQRSGMPPGGMPPGEIPPGPEGGMPMDQEMGGVPQLPEGPGVGQGMGGGLPIGMPQPAQTMGRTQQIMSGA